MPRRETRGLLYGALGVLAFSITLPATRAAVADLDPWVVGLGRAVVAAALAAVVLVARRERPLPPRGIWGRLTIVALGVVVGFPLFSALALRELGAAHSAVIVGGGLSAGPAAWLGFGYVAVFSMLLGFFAWYHGLALGGVARVGQIQLAQPLLTLVRSATRRTDRPLDDRGRASHPDLRRGDPTSPDPPRLVTDRAAAPKRVTHRPWLRAPDRHRGKPSGVSHRLLPCHPVVSVTTSPTEGSSRRGGEDRGN